MLVRPQLNDGLKQYFTNPKELLPPGFGGLQRGEPPANEPGPLNIPPPIQPLREPLQADTTFGEGIHSLLEGTTLNLTQQSSPIMGKSPQSPSVSLIPQTLPIISFPSVIQSPPIAPPIQIQATTMSAQPIAAQATITAPIDDKSSLQGKQPPVFNGTRSKADNFWRAFKIYRILNKDTNTIKSPFN